MLIFHHSVGCISTSNAPQMLGYLSGDCGLEGMVLDVGSWLEVICGSQETKQFMKGQSCTYRPSEATSRSTGEAPAEHINAASKGKKL